MAKNLKYTVPFVSLTGVAYEARIYVEGWTGTSTTLTAGPSPFSTEESGDDWLQPIAMQTGYLRIVCAESDWRGLVPTSPRSHFVKLVESGKTDTLWQGYIQYETYTHALYCGTAVYEFPLCSALSLLADAFLPWSPDRCTFASLIADILGQANDDGQWRTVYFPNNIAGSASTDLGSETGLLPFFDVEERIEHDGLYSYMKESYQPNATCLEILEEICKFWGWTLHEVGAKLYFCSLDEAGGWRLTTLDDLTHLSTSTKLPTIAQTTKDYAQLRWMSTDHDVSIQNPVQTIAIDGDTDGSEDIIDVDIARIAQFADLPSSVTLANGKYYAQCMGMTKFNNWLNGGVITTYSGAEGTNSETQASLISSGTEDLYGPVFRKSDTWEETADASKTQYNWTYDISLSVVKDSNEDTDGFAYLRFTTANEYIYSSCAIVVAAKVQCAKGITATSSCLEMMATIGNYHWDGSQWVQHGSEWRGVWVLVYIGDDSDRSQTTTNGSIVTTLNYRTPYQGASGYGMPVTSPLRGPLTITFRWMQFIPSHVQSSWAGSTYRLSDLKVKLIPAVTAYNGVKIKKHNAYTADCMGTGKVSIELAFLTKNNNLPASPLISIGDAWLEAMQWSDATTERPEEHLLARLTRLKGTGATEWRDIDINNADATAVAPYQEGNSKLLPVRVSREWGEGAAHVLLGKVL